MSLTLLYLDKNPLLGFDENIILPSRSSYSRMKYFVPKLPHVLFGLLFTFLP